MRNLRWKSLLVVLIVNFVLIYSSVSGVKAEEGIEQTSENEISNEEGNNPEETNSEDKENSEGENPIDGMTNIEGLEGITQEEPKNTIERLDVTAFLNHDGSANITELWKTNMITGTELTRIYTDFSSYKISNLTVEDRTTGRKYTYDENWNNLIGKEARDNKCGIVDLGNVVNICWGIGEYGTHEYVVRYTISDFVKDYESYQLIYLKVIQDNMDPVPRKS